MPRVKLVLEYDGTEFVGWQVQPNGRSVQGELENILSQMLKQPIRVAAAGRTDSGVHALGQVAAFTAPFELPMKAYTNGLNGYLPRDVAVVSAEAVPDDFDPRRWSLGKRYRYLISNQPRRSPFRARTHWELYKPLDLEAMQAAAPALIGRHDFSAFRAADCEAAHPIREVRSLHVASRPGEVIQIDVEGTAFLKHMVRNIVGSLVSVGNRWHPPHWMADVLASKDRVNAGATAPAHGLCLVEVMMGDGPRARGEVAADDG